ncbi:MAG: PD-(D/E)XK nuclease family protein [Oscillospiraceae bacterium]|nr:PD-(D/E)XK nuclease family protein [Oscillospiraceae bacterium]
MKIVTARAGHGKTTWAHERIVEVLTHSDQTVWLIVPEQYAYISERDLIDRIGHEHADRVRVCSFTRLAHLLLGKSADKYTPLSAGERAVLMSQTLEGLQDTLTLYAGKEAHVGTVHELLRLRTELHQNGVGTAALRQAAQKLPQDDPLGSKLLELAQLTDVYDAGCALSYFDEETLLDKLQEMLPQTHPLAGALVVFNAFHGLTGQQHAVLAEILKQAAEVDFLVCADSAAAPVDPAGAFTHTRNTAQALIRLGRQCGCKIQTLSLDDTLSDRRSLPAAASLKHLEQNLFDRDAVPYDAPAPEIHLHACGSLHDECTWAALQIKKLVRTTDMRCRDIAVIARDASVYEAPLRAALHACGLPLFQDSRQPVATQPLFLLLCAAMDFACEGARTAGLLQLLKTGLAGLDTEETARLENYAFLWQIDGSAWARPFTLHPDGESSRAADSAAEALAELETLRARVMTPLLALRAATRDALDGEAMARALWDLLTSLGTADALRGQVAALQAQGEDILAGEQARLWEQLVDFLDHFALLVTSPRPVTRLRELFSLLLDAQTIGSIPQGLDEPAIGSAHRMRFCQSPRAVFVLGCNAGVFPLEDAGGGLLSPGERAKLQKLDLPLSPIGEAAQAQERFFVYHALAAAREGLFLSYRTQTSDGSALLPSDFISEIRALFPQGLAQDDDALLFAESPTFAFAQLAHRRRDADSGAASIRAALAELPGMQGKLAALERAAVQAPFALTTPTAKDLFGQHLRFSASRAESYARCPFGYFCQYGVQAKARKRVQLDPMRRGTLLHFVLERLFADIGQETLLTYQKADCLPAIRALVEQYRAENMQGLMHSKQLAALLERNASVLAEVLWRLLEELRQSEFRPVGFEIELGGTALPAYALTLPGGGTISFTGRIDRVDSAEIGGEHYLRVVDYKSGGKKLQLSHVLAGLQVQLLIYLFALQKSDPAARPAAVVYQPLKLSVKKGDTKEEEQLSTVPSGLFLEDLRVLQAMERTLAGQYIPVGTKKDGALKKSDALCTLIQFAELQKQVDSLLVDFGSRLQEGEIDALPVREKSTDACAYCDYSAVCLHEDDDAVRTTT